MSIDNLGSFNIPITIPNLFTNNIDTPGFAQTLNIGVANANPIIIGQVGALVRVDSRLDVAIIDADVAVGSTLFLAPNDATNVAVGNPGGNPITCVSGILTNNINMGGSLGAGTLVLGNASSSTEVDIGQPLAPIKLLGGSVQFPSSGLPLVIGNSGVSQTVVVPFTGAITNSNGASLSFARFGDWVTVDFRHLLAVTGITVGFPISIINVIPAIYRPTNTHTFGAMINSTTGGGNQMGQVSIFISGSINIGEIVSGTYTGLNGGVFDWSYTYNVNT